MEIQENISLKDKNWFKTGGEARYYCEPDSVEEYALAFEFAKEKDLEVFFLGTGANILISDEGFDGLVVHPANLEPELISNNLVKASAGTVFQDVIDFCLDNNLIGLEDFSGIPGTVGGSTYINIHYFDFLLSDFLVYATVINKQTLEIENVNNDWFEFGYDKSKLFGGDYYLIDATFKVSIVDEIEAAYAKGRRDEIIKHRVRRYPNERTCGSFFRNFHDEEVDLEIGGKKMIFIAYYLDKVGVKGSLKVGNAIVSPRHANMIEAGEGSTSADIINLARKMQEMVKEEYGVVPKVECQLVGFKEWPLLK